MMNTQYIKAIQIAKFNSDVRNGFQPKTLKAKTYTLWEAYDKVKRDKRDKV